MKPNRALVIGGSVAGLLTARVLADKFTEVVILDRDRVPSTPEPRSGVPQSRHIHLLLARGFNIMEKYLPGLRDDLIERGALPLRYGEHVRSRVKTGWIDRIDTDVESMSCSRALLEHTIRQRVLARPNVTLCDGVQVDDLLLEHGRAVGVTVTERGGRHEPKAMHADFVVDASGRSSKAVDWLAAHGFGQAEMTVVDPFAGYATRLYRKPADFDRTWRVLYMPAVAPHTRGGGIFEIENGVWMVSLGGYGKDYPPTSDDEFLDFAATLGAPDLHDAIKDAEPLTSVLSYRRTTNRMIHYERLEQFPGHFVVLGDAVCGFNPIYGQGMTAAVMGVDLLAGLLDEYPLGKIGARFQRDLARQNGVIWLMATGEDFRFPTTAGDRPGFAARLAQRYLDQVIYAMPGDRYIADLFTRVINLLVPPTALMQPRVVKAVLRRQFGVKAA